IPKEMVVALC
ncbi:hypothetical protein W5Q_05285, partial [Candida albicans SC5314]